MNKIIIISGKSQSGKSTLAKYIFAEYINNKIGKKRFSLIKVGKEFLLADHLNNDEIISIEFPSSHVQNIFDTYSIKAYSFTDPLKELCVNILGLDPIQCYGSKDDLNSQTHIMWDNLSTDIRSKYSKSRRGRKTKKIASGYMTATEILQVMNKDIFEKIDENCWARGLYSLINKDDHDLSIVLDADTPNKITIGTEAGGKAIRLMRNPNNEHTNLDKLALGEYSIVIDNDEKNVLDTQKIIKPHLINWFGK